MEWTIGWWQISIQRVWPTNEQLTQMYNMAAPSWHRLIQCLGVSRAYAQLFQSLEQEGVLAHLRDNSTICDCGIGTAAFSLALAQTVPTRLNITGVDISPTMLQVAYQNLHQLGVKAQMCHGNVKDLPFSDNTFDLVISAHMLEHLSAPEEGFREMVRVLRPSKPLILVLTRRGLLGSLIQWHWGNGCLEPKTLTKMAAHAGLTNIRFRLLTVGLSKYTSIVCLGFKP